MKNNYIRFFLAILVLLFSLLTVCCTGNDFFDGNVETLDVSESDGQTDMLDVSANQLPVAKSLSNEFISNFDSGNELLNTLLKNRVTDLSKLPAYSFEDFVAWINNPGCDVTEELYSFNQKFPIRHIEITVYNDDLFCIRTFMTVTKLIKKDFDQPIYAYLPFQGYNRSSTYYYRLVPYFCTRTLTSADFDNISKGDSIEKIRNIEPAAGISQQITQQRYDYFQVYDDYDETENQSIILILDDGIVKFVLEQKNDELVVAYKFFFEYLQCGFQTSGSPAVGYINEWVWLEKCETPILP